MAQEIIKKIRMSGERSANLDDYERVVKNFRWANTQDILVGLPKNNGLNIAFEAVDWHASGRLAEKTAIRWINIDGESQDFSYKALSLESNTFANVLSHLGVGSGDKVYTLAGRIPELYFTFLGTLKNKSVFTPLFSAFGPEPIQSRMEIGGCNVIVTTDKLYKRKVSKIKDNVKTLRHILVISDEPVHDDDPRVKDFRALMREASCEFVIPPTDPEDQALLHFTSGTTGQPKGAMHVHNAVLMHKLTGQMALDLHEDDVYWCTADPGWVTGTSYGIISPLANGVTLLIDEAEFDPERWYQQLQDYKVNVWYTAPTAIRMLMKQGSALVKKYDLKHLRFLASVGEPLNPEAVRWGVEAFGRPFHDNWWQTETGGIMIANYAGMDVKPGSMGRPMPGVEAGIVERNATGIKVVESPGVEGELAIRSGWPSMFRGYLNQDEKYKKCFVDDWYLSGDLAKKDADGYYWFVGRADDVIKSAGHLIGPFEVESALLEHPAIAEAGVIGKPDETLLNIVKAFVTLKSGYTWGPETERSVMAHARKKLGPAVAPREISCLESLPKTRSGKIMRRLLKTRELGLPDGDTSTLMND